MPDLKLFLGDRNRSGWSLPPYLALQQCGAPFERVGLLVSDEDGATHPDAPGGRVPALAAGAEVVSGALDICEHLARRFPAAALWPTHAEDLAAARASAALATAAFHALERELPFRFLEKLKAPKLSDAAAQELAALKEHWARQRYKYSRLGPYLVGKLSIADMMHAPFVSRCVTYSLSLDEAAQEYVKTVSALPGLQRWAEAAGLDLVESGRR